MNHGELTKETARGLKILRERIDKSNIPTSELDKTLNIATWNIREFGKKKRSDAAIHYIAEILSQFDLVAIAELRDRLNDLNEVMKILGSYWKIVYSDYNSDSPGNKERMCYLYDGRSVRFTGLAAEVSPKRKKGTKGEYVEVASWWRAPYIAAFRAGHFDFVLVTAHIRWGKSEEKRAVELRALAEWVKEKTKEDGWDDKDIIVLGDFNIPSVDSPLYKAITLDGKGLRAPRALANLGFGSNLEKNKTYDQILHLPQYTNCFTDLGGVVDFYGDEKVLGSKCYKDLFPKIKDKKEFTYQLSDHLPLWIQLHVDTLDEQIDQILSK